MTADYEPYLIEITGDDEPFEDGLISEIQESEDFGWYCTSNGWTIGVPRLPIKVHGTVLREAIVPNVGDRIRLYGSFGHQVEGIQINDQVVYYRDQAQREASRRRWLEDHDARQRRTFTLRKDALDAEFDALPDLFKARIRRFREETPDFRVKDEGYEMFACTEAAKIADALGSVEAVEAFVKLPWEEQKQAVPGLSDGHSGNTFGGACMLARALIKDRAGARVDV